MATFKVGQRVKKVAARHPADYSDGLLRNLNPAPLGAEGTVTGRALDEVIVRWDGYPGVFPNGLMSPDRTVLCMPYMLASLTKPDEGFQRFMKKITTPAPEFQGVPLEAIN